jgi:tetratricopeptide (TPR) repeat protein
LLVILFTFTYYDKELTKMIQRSVSIRIVTVLDCCYSGAAKLSKGHEEDAAKLGTAAIASKANILEQGEGKCLLAASQAAQEAYALKEGENSIFTYYLLEGLRGNEKSVDGDGNITPYSLGNYIYRAILNLPANKRPKQKPITKVEASGDIILANYPKLAKIKADIGDLEDPAKKTIKTDVTLIYQDAWDYYSKGDYNKAIEYFDKALELNTNFTLAYNYNLRRHKESIACFDKAIEIKPNYSEALNNKGLALTSLGEYDKALECFSKSLDINPNNAAVWNNKGLVLNSIVCDATLLL